MALHTLIDGSSTIVEPWPRRVRGLCGNRVVVDSLRTQLHIPERGLPVYYFPAQDVATELLTPAGHRTDPLGERQLFSLTTQGDTRDEAGWQLTAAQPPVQSLQGHYAFRWNAMDAWFEEDDEIFVHPKSPYHRIDVLHSSREVRVEVAGVLLARSQRPRLLFETGLPTRFYLPVSDVRMDLLKASQTSTQCPYKGIASYWSFETEPGARRDIAWMYRYPIPECPKIEGLLSFFNERCDIWLDGEKQEKPVTPWS